MSRKRLILLAIISAAAFLGLGFYTLYNRSIITAKLTLEVAPISAKISVNGKKVRPGTVRVKPGKVFITFTKEGFSDSKKAVLIKANEEKFIGAVLKPNSNLTKNWYQAHPDDQKKAEVISSKTFNENSKSVQNNVPLVNKLPFIAGGFEFRIDYGSAPGYTDPTHPVIKIEASTPTARQDALTWIKNQGYDVSDFKVIFITGSEGG